MARALKDRRTFAIRQRTRTNLKKKNKTKQKYYSPRLRSVQCTLVDLENQTIAIDWIGLKKRKRKITMIRDGILYG